jgi:sugar/nucleoside kinase (ribokinase family)
MSVLGIGSPIIDLVLFVDDPFLIEISAHKGGMEIIDYHTLHRILEKSGQSPVPISGGSCSNTLKGLAHLGQTCSMIGRIGKDSLGQHFEQTMHSLQIRTHFSSSKTPTGQAACLITPDGERTFRTYVGAGAELRGKDLDPNLFKGVQLVHIEGYTLLCEDLTEKAMSLAKEADAKVSFDLASFELAESHREPIIDLLTKYVDVVFANELETLTLTGLFAERGCAVLKDICETVVVLQGDKGCWIGRGPVQIHCPAFPVNPIDTTGAGDTFASGFLHGYLQRAPLEECARFGAVAAREVVQVLGTEIPKEIWDRIKTTMGN